MSAEIHQVSVVDGRALHLRRLGRGPALVMLHESPRSSAVLLPMARHLARDFTVFAVDTPGYGASDPLRALSPDMGDFAEAVARSLEALGLRRAFVYGTHTGATIAAAMARRRPDFVAALVLDGYPAFTAQEREMHLRSYLPFFEPAWDGSHVTRLWARVRDQYAFFPWYLPGDSTRLPRAAPSPAQQTAVVGDILAAGPHYATAYAASFRFPAVEGLAELTMPACVVSHPDDLLFAHLDRFAPPEGVSVRRVQPLLEARAAAVRAAFLEAPAAVPPEAPPPRGHLAASADGALGASANLLLRSYGADAAPPLLLLHDSPGGAWEWDAVARREAGRRRVVVPELPGHGISAPLAADDEPADALVHRLTALADALRLDRFDLVGTGIGAPLACRLAAALPGRVGRLLLVDPPRPCSQPVTELYPFREPAWDGSHLVSAWFEQRDRLCYRPWCDRSPAAARRIGPGADVVRLHRRFTSQVRACNEHLGLAQALAGSQIPMDFAAARAATMLLAEDPDARELLPRLRAGGLDASAVPQAALADQVVSWLAA